MQLLFSVENDIDSDAFKLLTETDLQQLVGSLGKRVKILNYIQNVTILFKQLELNSKNSYITQTAQTSKRCQRYLIVLDFY